MRQRKSDEVLVAARQVFLDHGFEAATVEEIASEARVSKATIYSNFHDKDALLVAMIDRVTQESATILASVVENLEQTGTVEERLLRMGRALARGVLRPEVIRLRRLAISTAASFPGSARQYWERGPATAIDLLEQEFGAMAGDGELRLDDVAATASQFAYSLLGPLQDRAMFEVKFSPTTAEIERYVSAAVSQLLLAFGRD